ncbi:MAG TPA: hypothetical protein VKA51_14440, partial [Rubrobacteraceae bacterium]|nr:hypothetical protein [Rubrobacteraceae bacterium]
SCLGFHVVDRTDRHTLVGAGGRIGKLTLFDAPKGAEPSPGAIERITIRVADPASAAARLPREANVEQRNGEYRFTGPEGLPLALVQGEGDFVDYDLDGLALRAGDPEKAARGFVEMGFAPGKSAATATAGKYRLRFVPAESASTGGGMLFHVGCLVESAEDHRREAEERGLEVQDFVEGPNTLAVFVRGPEDVSVEYVEHKPSFSLT